MKSFTACSSIVHPLWQTCFLVFLGAFFAGATVSAGTPEKPVLSYAVYSDKSAEVFWERSTDDVLVVAYEVKRNGNIIATLDARSFYDNTYVAGENYEFVVTAIDREGGRSAPAVVSFVGGDRQSAGPIDPGEPADPVDPAAIEGPQAPSNLRYDVYSDRSAEIFWDRSTDTVLVTAYEIILNGRQVATRDAVSYYNNNYVAGELYVFNVIAINARGEKSEASSISFIGGDKEPAGPVDPTDPVDPGEPTDSSGPPAPANLRADVYSSSAFELFWDRVQNATLGYEITLNSRLMETTYGTSWYINDQQPGQQYSVQVVAVDDSDRRSPVSFLQVSTLGDSGSDPIDPGDPVGPTVFAPHRSDIKDPDSHYDMDGYAGLDVIRLDVRTVTTVGVCTDDDQSGCTLDDVKADTDPDDDFTVDIAVHLIGDDFPDDGMVSNAEMRQRGGTSRQAPQKSFRVKLDSKEVLWRNERRLQLNKHPNENIRIRNKLSFDLMRLVPHLPSLRTQFVNLWIDDGRGPEDYGLFTHVEYAGKEYLVNRGRNEDDNIYKVEFFQFSENDLKNVQVDENGKPLDSDLFELSLDPKRGEDHRKLVEMLTAINDPSQSFESVLDRYFNRNNVLMWVTSNLLLHATDAISHNFYLYNPAGSDTFYFLPWDYDSTFHPESTLVNSYDNTELQKRLFYGYARGFNSNFVSRYYRLPGIHQKILAAADEIRNTWYTDSTIAAKAQAYLDLADPYLSQSPDNDNIPNYVKKRGEEFAETVAKVHESMRSDFSIPMPPLLLNPITRGDKLVLAWKPAYDVTGHSITYDLQVASTVSFDAGNIVIDVKAIDDAKNLVEYLVDPAVLPHGKLYFRVTARVSSDPNRFWQIARNTLKIDGKTWYGVHEFSVP